MITFQRDGGFPGGAAGEEPTCKCRGCKSPGFSLWVGKTPWWRAWQPTPGGSHGQRGLVGYSPRGLYYSKESAMTLRLKNNNKILLLFLILISSWFFITHHASSLKTKDKLKRSSQGFFFFFPKECQVSQLLCFLLFHQNL